MSCFSRVTGSLVGMLCLACGTLLPAEPPAASKDREVKKPAPSKFIRITRDAQDQPVALETATVRYVPASGEGKLVVDLIGVVHVGDPAYYETLNRQLEQYDVVLYELVAPPGTRIPKGGKPNSDNPIAMIQRIMKTVLHLEAQTEQIDYTKKNFVHADLSPEQMAEAIRKRGDDGVTLALSIAADILRQQNLQERQKQGQADDEPEIDLSSLLLDPDGAVKLKRLMAQQMQALETPQRGLGDTLNTILIRDRNAAAMTVFQKELAKGKKKIAIFFGAGHMPDFEKRLRDDFGLKPIRHRWLTAWDLRPTASDGEGVLGDLLKLFGQ